MIAILIGTYSIVDLHISSPNAFMNDSGMVSGKMLVQNSYRCFRWQKGHLETLPENIQEVFGMNSKGDLAVRTQIGAGRWSNGKFELADKYFRGAIPRGIDDSGRLIGEISTGSEGLYSVACWPPRNKRPLSGFPSSGYEQGFPPRPTAVAPDGSFVGNRNMGRQSPINNQPAGWLTSGSQTIPVGDVQRQTRPTCISSNHHVGGSFRSRDYGFEKPFAWFNDVLNELPLPTGDQAYGGVISINNKGDAVGNGDWQVKISDGIANLSKGLFWKNGKCIVIDDLLPTELGLEVDRAFAINNAGQILVEVYPAKTHWPRSLSILTPK